MKRGPWTLVLTTLILLSSEVALAVVPDLIPFQGVLRDDEGNPVDEAVTLTFRLYDGEHTVDPFWTEEQVVDVVEGNFSAYLGDIDGLPAELISLGEVWLGISVNDDEEMERFEIGSVPYALEAQTCQQVGSLSEEDISAHNHDGEYAPASAGVPAGAVMFFNADACPAGWSPLAGGQGRVLVGAAPGASGTSVGTALADGGLRTISEVPAHNHTVDPAPQPVTVDEESEHTHSVDPAAFSTPADEGGHVHEIYMSLAGGHGHTFRIENLNGFGDYALAGSENNSGGMTYTTPEAGDHRHNLTVYSSTHTHTINVPPTTTYSTEPHTHTASFDMPAFQTASTGAAAVDVTMPYLQLLVCVKD